MQKVLKVDGMMCSHCEAKVEKALKAVDGVEEAKADHEAKKVTVTLSGDVTDEALLGAVIGAGYEALGVEA